MKEDPQMVPSSREGLDDVQWKEKHYYHQQLRESTNVRKVVKLEQDQPPWFLASFTLILL